MRHRKKINHLSRKSAHRKAMLSNMATSLIMHKRIHTTVAKAKALKVYVEPLITKSKDDTTHSRRVVFSYLQSKEAVSELFREVSAKVADRPGGYTRIIRIGNRLGDNAEMCMIELVDFNENMLADKVDKKAKTTRRRRGGKKKVETDTETVVVETPVEAAAEIVEENVEESQKTEKEQTIADKEDVKTETVAEVPDTKVEEKDEPKEEIKDEKPAEDGKVKDKEEAKTEVKPEVEKPSEEVKEEESGKEKKADNKEETK
ncbi:MAG: 50S ribosomal protein L17 [Bacteroidales bacterium]|nr:50S ribosomal protein L17 [Bacteroidales bacterium]